MGKLKPTVAKFEVDGCSKELDGWSQTTHVSGSGPQIGHPWVMYCWGELIFAFALLA